jgi:hypothetical protein
MTILNSSPPLALMISIPENGALAPRVIAWEFVLNLLHMFSQSARTRIVLLTGPDQMEAKEDRILRIFWIMAMLQAQ